MVFQSSSPNDEQNEYATNDVTNGHATTTSDVHDGTNGHGTWYGDGHGQYQSVQHHWHLSCSSPYCFHAYDLMGYRLWWPDASYFTRGNGRPLFHIPRGPITGKHVLDSLLTIQPQLDIQYIVIFFFFFFYFRKILLLFAFSLAFLIVIERNPGLLCLTTATESFVVYWFQSGRVKSYLILP